MTLPATIDPWMLVAAGIVLGAIVGSFLATLLVRWPAGESALGGRSRCDACGATVRAIDLVPIVSFGLRRGQCRACDAQIDRAHITTELAAAAIGGTALALAPGLAGVGWAVLGWALLLLAIFDWRHFWLPDPLTIGLAAAGLALGGAIGTVDLGDRAIGLAAGFGALWLVAVAYRAVRGREGLGGGDPKLFGAIGAWLGWQALPFVLFAASLIGLLLVLIAAAGGRRMTGATPLPFGTLLCLATLPGWLAARSLGLG